MSQNRDEIVFDEVRYREPQKLRRPDRDRRWVCASYEVPLPVDLPIFLDLKAADAIERHALRDTSVELGGILLGKEGIDDMTGDPFVWVTESLEAKHYENTQASFTYTHDSWEEITRERDARFPDLEIVGWYHTHPDFGVFLSSHDLFIHRNFFGQPLQLAYVVDPIRQTRNFFQWRDGRMEQVGGFLISAERTDRVRLARHINELENQPSAQEAAAELGSGGQGHGSGFSPRLESELIAMLARQNAPHHQGYQNYGAGLADRTQTALLFGLLGTIAGVLLVSLFVWLNQMSGLVAEQSRAITEIERTTRDTADRQRIALDSALADLPTGKSAERFLEQYNRIAQQRDDAKRLLDDKTAINDVLGAKTKQLSDQVELLKQEQAKLKTVADDAKEAPELRRRVAELEQSSQTQADKIKEYEATLETVDGQKAVELHGSYVWTWYSAVLGWTLTLLFGVTLVGGYALLHRDINDEAKSQDVPLPPHPDAMPPIKIQ